MGVLVTTSNRNGGTPLKVKLLNNCENVYIVAKKLINGFCQRFAKSQTQHRRIKANGTEIVPLNPGYL